MTIIEARKPSFVPKPGYGTFWPKDPVTAVGTATIATQGGDPAHVLVPLHAGRRHLLRGDRGVGRGARLVELDHPVQKLALPSAMLLTSSN
jgi:hypothetical protein